MAAPSVSAVETDGVVPIAVEVILMGGSEIDLVIPLFTKSSSSTFDHSRRFMLLLLILQQRNHAYPLLWPCVEIPIHY